MIINADMYYDLVKRVERIEKVLDEHIQKSEFLFNTIEKFVNELDCKVDKFGNMVLSSMESDIELVKEVTVAVDNVTEAYNRIKVKENK